MKRSVTAIVALLLSTAAQAGWIAQNATVKRVENTSNNVDMFAVVVEGGSGPCVSTASQTQLIFFPRANAGSEHVHDRAFAMVLSAQATQNPVSIYNYLDDSCGTAVGVSVSN